MRYRLMMILVSEGQEGNLGEDWKYDLGVKVFNNGLQNEASVEVPKHRLESGRVEPPFGSPPPVELYQGEAGEELLLRFHLVATEVDLFVNDVGSVSKDLQLQLPAPGEPALSRELDLAAGVRESPGIRDLNAVFTLRIRLAVEKAD
jgi:hypothetical protein